MNQRRQSLLVGKTQDGKGKKFGEMAGGAAAECAAVCCCCPFTVMNLLVLAVYKVPTGLCKKAWRKHRKRQRRVKRKQVGGLLMGTTSSVDGDHGVQKQELLVADKASQELELEKEMWDQFHATGFWRSPSQSLTPSQSQRQLETTTSSRSTTNNSTTTHTTTM